MNLRTHIKDIFVIPAQAGIHQSAVRREYIYRWILAFARMTSLLLSIFLLTTSALAQDVQYFNVHSGTGFFVNRDYLVTNAHVVKGCTKVIIGGAVPSQEAVVYAVDEDHDLALIQSDAQPAEFAPLRMDIDTIKVGDDVTIVGFPGQKGFQGQTSVATAKVQKLELDNLGNTWRFFITDVIQHGNSGGPVLDSSGNVIGVAEGMMQFKTVNADTQEKISEMRFGMVITLRTLQHFLEDHGVYAQWTGSGLLMFADGTLEANAKRYIVNVQCRIETSNPESLPQQEPMPEIPPIVPQDGQPQEQPPQGEQQ